MNSPHVEVVDGLLSCFSRGVQVHLGSVSVDFHFVHIFTVCFV